MYLPEEPFIHGSLVRGGRLKSFPSLGSEAVTSEYRQPCVVFTGHPSLRCGDVVHFMELWANNVNNLGKKPFFRDEIDDRCSFSVVFTEPSINYQQALAPYQPMAMKVVHCPIDTSLNFTQAKKLLRDTRPNTLVIPHRYTQPPASAPARQDLVIDVDITTLTFQKNDIIKIPLVRKLGTLLCCTVQMLMLCYNKLKTAHLSSF